MEERGDTRPLSVGEWMLTILVLGLPLVGFIMLLVWGLSSGGNTNRRNYCRAVLFWILIGLGIVIGLALIMAVLAAIAGSGGPAFQ